MFIKFAFQSWGCFFLILFTQLSITSSYVHAMNDVKDLLNGRNDATFFHFSSPYFQRIPERYLEETYYDPRCLVLGSGNAYARGYPLNYFSLDEESDVEPDLIANITQADVIPASLKGKFDYVVWEHLPVNLLLSSNLWENVKAALKPKGVFLGNLSMSLIENMEDKLDLWYNFSACFNTLPSSEIDEENIPEVWARNHLKDLFQILPEEISSTFDDDWWRELKKKEGFMYFSSDITKAPFIYLTEGKQGIKKAKAHFREDFAQMLGKHGFQDVSYVGETSLPIKWLASSHKWYFIATKGS